MEEIPRLPHPSPQSAHSNMNSSPSRRRSSVRISSPLKPCATTPSRTRLGSPRKSPAKNRIFQSLSGKTVSFTPEKTKQPPRAWERRPATPFIPRDDKQKIWKRVPLGELGLDHHKPVGISRREQEAGKDYLRIVKKLKVGHNDGTDDEDKENVSYGAKLQTEDVCLKRVAKADSLFVTMKMEEDVISGSPKKKLRLPTNECHASEEEDLLGSHEADICEIDVEVAEEEHNEKSDASHITRDVEQDEQGAEPRLDEGSTGNAIPKVAPASDIPEEHVDDSEEVSEEVSPSQLGNNSTTSNEGIVMMHIDLPTNATLSYTIGTSTSSDVDVQVESEEEIVSNHDHDASEDIDCENSPDESEESAGLPNDEIRPMEEEESESPVTTLEEPRSSSPPTILAENVVIDELESRNTSNSSLSAIASETGPTEQVVPQSSTASETQDTSSRRISDGETTFLRNFVSTTKAERAAREKQIQDRHINEAIYHQEEKAETSMATSEEPEQNIAEAQETPILEAPSAEQAEMLSGSPLRRSKRAAITSIPRPQILPNAIQLKRANGNEFIFTANKASSIANVAVMTRSNTKRNKGSALNVPERLEQLMVEDNGSAEDAKLIGSQDGLGEPPKKSEHKKRKREGKDGNIRVKKVLRWNDDNLVSYQEAENCLYGSDDIEDSSQENIMPHHYDDAESEKHVKLTLTLTSKSDSANKDQEEDYNSTLGSSSTSTSSQSKVRRVRRGTSGTVNGTPGPKTRSRKIVMTEDQVKVSSDQGTTIQVHMDTDGIVEDSSAAITAINTLSGASHETSKSAVGGVVKKSRMPMPISSAARRGAAASASIRTAGAVLNRHTSASGSTEGKKGESEKAKTEVQTRTQKDEASKGDVLGKRRLRVRS